VTQFQPRIRTVEGVQVTAENAAEVAARLPDGTVTGDGVTFTVFETPVTATFGWYVFWNRDGTPGAWPAEDFEHDYEPTPDPTNRELIDALTARIGALEAARS
jgi:hypothetical protein